MNKTYKLQKQLQFGNTFRALPVQKNSFANLTALTPKGNLRHEKGSGFGQISPKRKDRHVNEQNSLEKITERNAERKMLIQKRNSDIVLDKGKDFAILGGPAYVDDNLLGPDHIKNMSRAEFNIKEESIQESESPIMCQELDSSSDSVSLSIITDEKSPGIKPQQEMLR